MIMITENEIRQMVLESVEKIKHKIMEEKYHINKTPINEAFSEKLYHFTTIRNLESMLKNGIITLYKATPGESYDFKMNTAKPIKHKPGEYYNYYICLTRQRNGETGYPAQMNGRFNNLKGGKIKPKGRYDKYCVRIEVDSKVMAKYFKHLNVNYFSPNNTNAWVNKKKSFVPIEKRFELKQTEERGLTNQAEFSIKEHPELIKRIDIYFPNKYDKRQESIIKKLKWIIKSSPLKHKIFYYNNINDFNGLKKVDGSSELQPRDSHNFEFGTSTVKIKNTINNSTKEKISKYVLMITYATNANVDDIIDNILKNVYGFKNEVKVLKQSILKKIEKISYEYKNNPWEIFKTSPSLGACVQQNEGFIKSIFISIKDIFQRICAFYKCDKITPVALYNAMVKLERMPIKPKKIANKKEKAAYTTTTIKKRGRPRKMQTEPVPTPPRKRGRPRKMQTEPIPTSPRKRGRPRKNSL